MSASRPSNGLDRLMELLADRAVQGLSPAEKTELDALLASNPAVNAEWLDFAAAAADLAMSGAAQQPMPARIAERLRVEGVRLVSAEESGVRRHVRGSREAAVRTSRGRRVGWIAAVVCAVIAALGWWPRMKPAPSAESELASLERSGTDVVRAAWQPGNDTRTPGVTGEVVWSPAGQVGFMVFEGLPPNDARAEQYQLWIFDSAGDEKAPVHGGVFDACADSSGRCVVKFVPRLAVKDATLFAVTVEKPGGVWVSKRERIPVLASVKKL